MAYLDKLKERNNYEKNEINEITPLQARNMGLDPTKENEKSPVLANPLVDHLLDRLRKGLEWLTAQHQAWDNGDPDATSDKAFSAALAAWTEMEQSLRAVFDLEGCVLGPDQQCPEDAPVRCDACCDQA
jgi:hypothetical protein